MDDIAALDQLDSFNFDVGTDEHDVDNVGANDFMQVATAVADAPTPPLAAHAVTSQVETSAPPSEPETDMSGQAQAATAAASSYKPYPTGTKLLMAQAEDSSWLTPYLCLLRSQLEVFSATPEEIAAKLSTGGNKVPPIPGQVGIRCVHCQTLEYKQRAKSSESFPSCIKNVHQAVRNYQRHHYPKCQAIPGNVRAKVESIKSAKKAQKSRGSAGNYWMASCVRDLHMVDGKDGRAGIFFAGTEDAGEVPDVSHMLGGESSGAPPVEMSSGAAGSTKSSGGSKKKKTKAPKIKKAIKSMFRKDSGAPDNSVDGFATMNASAQSGASGTVSSIPAGTLNRNGIPQLPQQLVPQPMVSNDAFRRNSTGNVPLPQITQQVHTSATMQMYSPNWELINNHGVPSALTPPPSSSAMPMNLPNPAVVTGADPTGGFQVGTSSENGAQGGRRASFPAGGSEFPIEMFEPRPLREDGQGFVDESANDPAASAYFAASNPIPARAPQSSTIMPSASGNASRGAMTNDHGFQTEYGFMGINDVVKGHEEAEKSKRGSYRLDRRSSWTSRDSHGSSTFLSSGSKRGLSDDGDSVGTNEYEPPRRRPSLQSSLGGDLDDFGGLDLDNDVDFNDDFGISDGAPQNNAAFSEVATAPPAAALPLDQPHQFSSGGGGVGGSGHKPGSSGTATTVGTMGKPATNSTRAGRSDSNLSDGSFTKALQVLDEVIAIEPFPTGTATATVAVPGAAAGAPSSSLAPTANNPHAQQQPPP